MSPNQRMYVHKYLLAIEMIKQSHKYKNWPNLNMVCLGQEFVTNYAKYGTHLFKFIMKLNSVIIEHLNLIFKYCDYLSFRNIALWWKRTYFKMKKYSRNIHIFCPKSYISGDDDDYDEVLRLLAHEESQTLSKSRCKAEKKSFLYTKQLFIEVKTFILQH